MIYLDQTLKPLLDVSVYDLYDLMTLWRRGFSAVLQLENDKIECRHNRSMLYVNGEAMFPHDVALRYANHPMMENPDREEMDWNNPMISFLSYVEVGEQSQNTYRFLNEKLELMYTSTLVGVQQLVASDPTKFGFAKEDTKTSLVKALKGYAKAKINK